MFNPPMCYDRVHFHDEPARPGIKKSPSCAAFDDIPADIWLSQFDHRNEKEQDNGIQFELKKGSNTNPRKSHFLLSSPDAPVPPGFNADGSPSPPLDPLATTDGSCLPCQRPSGDTLPQTQRRGLHW
jgi:hypothetical protein